MKNYYRIMLGRGSDRVAECLAGSFIGIDYGINQDLTGKLSDEWREFNKEFIPIYLKDHPDKTRVAAGLACGALWTVGKGIQMGDIVISPDGLGHYHVGEVIGDYVYQSGGVLPHRRPVHWFDKTFDRADMSEELRKSTGFTGSVTNVTGFGEEIERLIAGITGPKIYSTDQSVEDPSAFVMEKHLEEFLIENWAHTEFGKDYSIYEVDGERVGEQFETDTGPIDILAISKDKKSLMVIELKKGRASDAVVGQLLRYMGFVKEELAEAGQKVKGVIIAVEEDQRVRRALSMVPNIEFYRYQISFKLKKV